MSPRTTAAVLAYVVDQVRERSTASPDLVRTAFVTGSYARGLWKEDRPNLNVYFIAHEGRAVDLRIHLAHLWRELAQELMDDDLQLQLDCHPFTLAQRAPGRARRTLTVTTKVLESEHRHARYRLPPTIGPGWADCFDVLVGHADDLDVLRSHPRRTEDWIRTVRNALTAYRNILDHLPWALDWQEHPHVLLEESVRYAEEAVKDAIALRLTDDELRSGRHIELLAGWSTAAASHLADRYGPAGEAVHRDVVGLLAAGRAEARPTPDEALDTWRTAVGVCGWAWDELTAQVREMGLEADDLTRLDSFL